LRESDAGEGGSRHAESRTRQCCHQCATHKHFPSVAPEGGSPVTPKLRVGGVPTHVRSLAFVNDAEAVSR
jgi:hypothetical protein